jgi:CubicO group peptidase (beta-lactamase class C family)
LIYVFLGNFLYKNVAGYNGVAQDAKPLELDQTFFIASCTKLIATIAMLQVVERGLFHLDDPIDSILPELASQPILEQKGDGTFSLHKAVKSITLRQLLTHTSGATYDWASAKLIAWRISRRETPFVLENGDIAKGYAYPRAYEAGESWDYSGGLDWASLLVERLTKQSFETYVEENIAKPLAITSFTWHLSRKPEVAQKIMNVSSRQEDGTLTEGPTPFWAGDPVGEGGGAGMYANVADYTRVLSDLLKTAPTLLRKETVDQMFSPQFAEGSNTLRDLAAHADFSYKPALDDSVEGVNANHGLGGLLLMEDVERVNYFQPKGTLTWTGLPNLKWSVNRERGLATFFATQVAPWADRKTFDLIARFETAVWQNLQGQS